jgi:hypothetical protein
MALISKSGIHWLCLEEGIRQVKLPNGRKIELASREGADDFVDTVGTDFISTNLTAANDAELMFAYTMITSISDHASPEKIASGIPESELRTFVEHSRDTLKTLSTDRTWLRSGTVSMWHNLLLQAVASFSKHPSFLKIFVSDEGMEAVAKFYASRKKNDTPSQSVAQSIIFLVMNAFIALYQEGAGEKAFGTIEKTGLLGQFIRCVPVKPEDSAAVVKSLHKYLQLVKKKFRSGTRTGDILDAVIAGEDGPINEKVKSLLAELQSLARLSNDYDNKSLKMCRHCVKSETLGGAKLMKCQRCEFTYYCSKECQVANWKSHKKMCKAVSTANVSPSVQKTSQATMWAFVESHYFDIAKEVYKKTQEYNVPKKDLFMEIDFDGDAPIQVWLMSDFFKESALEDAPEWFRTETDKKLVPRYLREAHERLTSNDLLAVYRSSNGMVNVQILRFPVANTGYELLSDEAVESIGREDYVRMVACLGQPFTNMYFDQRSGLV